MIGTHNSMTYLSPKKWYLWPFRFIAKCLSKSIKEQYEDYGIRLFDFRIAFDKNFRPEFRHGMMRYSKDVFQVLDYLNSKKELIYIRLVLEKTSNIQESLFRMFCRRIEKEYPNLKFFEGVRKSDWKRIYQFKNEDLPLKQMISSMTWLKIDDWWPWLYARFMNKKNRIKYKNEPYLLLDFVEI